MSDYKSAHADNDDYLDEKEGDSRMISMARDDDYDESEDSDYKTHLRPRKVRQGMGLDLSRAPAKGDEEDSGKGIQETNVLVVFDLPDGSQGESFFKLGQTVEVLKSYVESEYGIPMSQQFLFLENLLMMDPLSLLDFAEAKGVDEVYIRVEGPLPSDAKK